MINTHALTPLSNTSAEGEQGGAPLSVSSLSSRIALLTYDFSVGFTEMTAELAELLGELNFAGDAG